ncbi:hypothetical protein [Silvanigrella aquatica]|nr:hypothetical protein [Silvanigrella aquatica]
MATEYKERGFYYHIFKQDVLKKDVWTEHVTVFARNALAAAELYVEIHCQYKDFVHSIKEISSEEFDVIVRGEHNYEGKYKLKINFEMDLEIPAYLRGI